MTATYTVSDIADLAMTPSSVPVDAGPLTDLVARVRDDVSRMAGKMPPDRLGIAAVLHRLAYGPGVIPSGLVAFTDAEYAVIRPVWIDRLLGGDDDLLWAIASHRRGPSGVVPFTELLDLMQATQADRDLLLPDDPPLSDLIRGLDRQACNLRAFMGGEGSGVDAYGCCLLVAGYWIDAVGTAGLARFGIYVPAERARACLAGWQDLSGDDRAEIVAVMEAAAAAAEGASS